MSDGQAELGGKGLHPGTGNLFLVRLWDEEGEDPGKKWGGRLLHVTTGRAHSFQDWPELVRLLTLALDPGQDDNRQQT